MSLHQNSCHFSNLIIIHNPIVCPIRKMHTAPASSKNHARNETEDKCGRFQQDTGIWRCWWEVKRPLHINKNASCNFTTTSESL